MSHGVMFQRPHVRLTTQVPAKLQLSKDNHAGKDLTAQAMSPNGGLHSALVMPFLPGLSSLHQGRPYLAREQHSTI